MDHNRTRNKTVSFWMSPEEYRNLLARVKITGLAKNEFMIRALLGQQIEIRVGKFESDRLSVELKRLREALLAAECPTDVTPLLLECRALLEQVITITQGGDPHCSTS
ncbi:MAG: hypothetical protein IJE07_06360 [Clostridia bacterium]|nr:hypothetical protein [Clostridia bacterium]